MNYQTVLDYYSWFSRIMLVLYVVITTLLLFNKKNERDSSYIFIILFLMVFGGSIIIDHIIQLRIEQIREQTGMIQPLVEVYLFKTEKLLSLSMKFIAVFGLVSSVVGSFLIPYLNSTVSNIE